MRVVSLRRRKKRGAGYDTTASFPQVIAIPSSIIVVAVFAFDVVKLFEDVLQGASH